MKCVIFDTKGRCRFLHEAAWEWDCWYCTKEAGWAVPEVQVYGTQPCSKEKEVSVEISKVFF